jgi:hypothetical protein
MPRNDRLARRSIFGHKAGAKNHQMNQVFAALVEF